MPSARKCSAFCIFAFFREMQGFCKVAARFPQGWRDRMGHVSKPDALRWELASEQ